MIGKVVWHTPEEWARRKAEEEEGMRAAEALAPLSAVELQVAGRSLTTSREARLIAEVMRRRRAEEEGGMIATEALAALRAEEEGGMIEAEVLAPLSAAELEAAIRWVSSSREARLIAEVVMRRRAEAVVAMAETASARAAAWARQMRGEAREMRQQAPAATPARELLRVAYLAALDEVAEELEAFAAQAGELEAEAKADEAAAGPTQGPQG